MAREPETSFSLSDVARRLQLNKATTHALLSELADRGYLVRHANDKTYSLGPAAVALGVAAGRLQHQIIELARPRMRALASKFDADCVAITAIGNEAIALESIGPGRSRSELKVGQRTPLTAPLGGIYVAWSRKEVIELWLRNPGPSAPDPQLSEVLSTIRRRGYGVGLSVNLRAQLSRAIDDLQAAGGDDSLRRVVDQLLSELVRTNVAAVDLDDDRTYQLGYITAPVFNATSAVILTINLSGFAGPVRGSEAKRRAQALMHLTSDLTREIHGQPPPGYPTAT
jgi:DNA-binding IclR family transcriptional regulator